MLHDKLKKLMEKKKAGGDSAMPEHEKHAKMAVLHELKRQAHEAMGQGLHHLKKVSVMSNDEGGLMDGLDKAKEIVADASNAEAGDPLKGEIHPDDISDTQDSDDDGDEGNGGDYSEPGVSEHSDEDSELPEQHGNPMPPKAKASPDMEPAHGGIKAHMNEEDGSPEDDEDMDENEVHQKLAKLIALRDKLHAKKPRI